MGDLHLQIGAIKNLFFYWSTKNGNSQDKNAFLFNIKQKYTPKNHYARMYYLKDGNVFSFGKF